MEHITITVARNEMPALLRRISDDPDTTLGITVNGRLEGVLTGPNRSTDLPSGWIDSHGLPRDRMPEETKELLEEDSRGTADLWIHLDTGAFVILVPRANWDQAGGPAVYYIPPDRRNRVELSWPLGQWDGTNAHRYGEVMDSARRYIAQRLIAAT